MSIFYPILVSFWFNFGVENRTRSFLGDVLEASLARLGASSGRFGASLGVLKRLGVSGSLQVAAWGGFGAPWALRGLQNTPKKWDSAVVCRNLQFAVKLDAKRNDFCEL